MERHQVVDRVRAICRDVHTLATSSYGPRGRVKVLLPNADVGVEDAVVTSKAERICDRIGTSDCPVASVYMHILKSRLRNHSDGGLFTMLLSTKLLLLVHDGCLGHTPLQIVAQGYRLALEWCVAYLDDAACPVRVAVDWGDTVGLYAVVRGILEAKPVARTCSFDDAFIRLLIDAFITVLPYVLAHPGESVPIHFIHDKAFASTLASSQVIKDGLVLEWTHHCDEDGARLLPLQNALVPVLLFSVSIDPSLERDDDDGSQDGGIVVHTATEHTRDYDHALIEAIGDRIIALQVAVVLCQKLIPDVLQRRLHGHRILCIQRLGITHMRSMQALTGAIAIGDWRVLEHAHSATQMRGYLTSVSTIPVSHKPMLVLKNKHRSDRSWPVATLVLTAPSESIYDELTYELTTTFSRLSQLMEHPHVVAGAGCTEIHLAAWLRRHCELLVVDSQVEGRASRTDLSTLRHLRTTIQAFADALESIAVALDHCVHGMVDEVIEELRTANDASLTELPDSDRYDLYGWDPFSGSPRAVATVINNISDDSGSSSSSESEDESEADSERRLDKACVLDILATKKTALTAAVDCAAALLRVAHVVDTHT